MQLKPLEDVFLQVGGIIKWDHQEHADAKVYPTL